MTDIYSQCDEWNSRFYDRFGSDDFDFWGQTERPVVNKKYNGMLEFCHTHRPLVPKNPVTETGKYFEGEEAHKIEFWLEKKLGLNIFDGSSVKVYTNKIILSAQSRVEKYEMSLLIDGKWEQKITCNQTLASDSICTDTVSSGNVEHQSLVKGLITYLIANEKIEMLDVITE